MRTVTLTKETTKDILENLLKRSPNQYGSYETAVREILAKIQEEGDGALLHTRRNLTGRKSQNRMYGLRMRKSAKPMRLWIRLLWM